MTLDARRLAAALAAHGPVARVVVAETRGSVPRGPGTEMLVWADGFDGTIGGGALEWRALEIAREVLATGAARLERMPLGPALGQCCGGAVTLAIERLEAVPGLPWMREISGVTLADDPAAPSREIWVWGAGHVGTALVHLLAPLPDLALTWVDTAADRIPAPPPGVTPLVAADPARAMAHAPPKAEHLILTWSHEIDLALCHAALRRGFRSCGLIGSTTKWARFRTRLAALGHADAHISRIDCPIGDPALGKHPQAIAVGVAAALLSRRSPARAARGSPGEATEGTPA